MAVSVVNRLTDELLRNMLTESPDIAAHLGIRDVGGEPLPQDALTDFSAAGIAQRRGVMEMAARELDAVDPSALHAAERGTYDVLHYFLNDGMFWFFHGRSGARFPEMPYPLNPLEGAHQVLGTLLMQDHVLSSPEDAEAYVSRLKRLPDALDQVIDAARDRMHDGYRPARRFLEQAQAELPAPGSPGEMHPLLQRLADSAASCGVGESAMTAMLKDAGKVFSSGIAPAYAALAQEMSDEAALDAPPLGLWSAPDGEAHYAFLLRGHTTTDLTPAEIHERGLAEVQAVSERIRRCFARIGMDGGTVGEMYGALQAQPDARYPADAEGRRALQADASRLVDELAASCAALFDRMPRAACRIEPAAEVWEASTVSHYTPPSADGSRPGQFTINVKDTLDRLRWELPVLCRHEIMPGHHLQLALAQELSHLPAFRRAIVFNAYIEGWAKYAEALPEEAGLSDDPYVELCRLRGELYSTVNLVLDTGFNAMRWPFERAVSYFVAMTGAPQGLAELNAARSLFHPGQLCSYKIGMSKMLELKARLQRARGSRFRIQEFHSIVLEEGALPLSLLERRIDDAIALH